MLHLHVGAGALGLGLLVPASVAAGVPCHIFNRISSSATPRLELMRRAGGYHLNTYPNDDTFIELAGVWDYGSDEGLAMAREPGIVLVTTALKRAGLVESVSFIASLLNERPANSQTIVVAGENQVDSDFLKAELEKTETYRPADGHLFVNAVVDRICNKVWVSGGRVEVDVEPFARVYVEQDSSTALLPADLVDGEVWKLVPDLKFAKRRKKWIVNATHLLITFAALRAGEVSVKEFVEGSVEGQAVLYGIITETVRMMVGNETSGVGRASILAAELTNFGADLYARVCMFPQAPYDAVTRFGNETMLFEFLEDYHRKVNEPYVQYLENGKDSLYWTPLISGWIIAAAAQKHWITPPPLQ